MHSRPFFRCGKCACAIYSTIMNRLAIHGINLEVSASEFERSITRSLSAGSISSVRNDLFTEAMEAGLASVGDALVKRRKTNCGKTVKQKHVSDLWQLVCSIKNKTPIPRTLLRNGKRSKDQFHRTSVLCAIYLSWIK